MRVVDLAQPPPVDWRCHEMGIVIARGDPAETGPEMWVQRSTLVLTEIESDDLRTVRVDSIPEVISEIGERVAQCPQAATGGPLTPCQCGK